MLPTIAREADAVVMIDQRKLPVEEVYVRCTTAAEVARAIKTMVIRGAPAIGVAAAMGIALGMRRSTATGHAEVRRRVLQGVRADGGDAADGRQPVLGDRSDEAVVRRRRPRPASRSSRSRTASSARRRRSTTRTSRAAARWARSAPTSCRTTRSILTHCNAGALATAGYGTALGVIRGAVEAGKQRRGVRRRDAAVPAGRPAHRVGAGARRHRHDRHHRQHGRRADAPGRGRTSSSSAPTASPPTATSRTRSAPTRSRCSRASTRFRSTSPRRCRPSISTTPDGAHIPIEERSAKEVTHVGGAAARARRRAGAGTRRST